MRVFSDLHHDDLYNSLRMLFEGRLGWELYRPIGMDWHTQGFWRVYDHPATAEQYLGLHQGTAFAKLREEQPNGGHRWLNDGLREFEDGVYLIPNPTYPDHPSKAVTLSAFARMPFDIVVSSMPPHFEAFERLVAQYKPNAKHIFQMGNQWGIPTGVKNLLNSTTVSHDHVYNPVRYHQEFDLGLFNPIDSDNVAVVRSFLHYNEHHGRVEFMALKSMMPDWVFLEKGAGNLDGPVPPGQMPTYIKNSGLVFHVKCGGDGYGYNIHHAAACGKAVLYNSQYVYGQTAASLLIDGVTGIDLHGRSLEHVVSEIRRCHAEGGWQSTVHDHFKKVCDFDREFEQIKWMLGRLM